MPAERGKQTTFLQRLGFEDEDLRSPEHDRMSFFLAITENFRKVAENAGFSATEEFLMKYQGYYSDDMVKNYWSGQSVRLEVPITKGEGQYATIIGYADAVFRKTAIEAKTSLPNPMETLRQLNTYRSFFRGAYILWLPSIDEKTASVFRSQGIFVSNLSI